MTSWVRLSGRAVATPGRNVGPALILILAIFVRLAQPASAQSSGDLQQLWGAVLAHPGDLDLGYRYAQALIGAGRYDDAAAEFERMLIIEPDQPRLRMEVGVLYLRLGNYVLAQVYLNRALETPGLPADLRGRLQSYLEEAKRRTGRSQWSGTVSFGARYQSNANGGIRASGIPVNIPGAGPLPSPIPLPPNLRERADVNAFIEADLVHTYDLQLPREAEIVTGLGAYVARQTSPDFYNLTGATLRTGLRFALAPDTLPTLRVYPYVLTDLLFLNDRFFNLSGGLGLQFDFKPARGVVVSVVGEGRGAHYDDVPRVSQGALLTGTDKLGAAQVTFRLSPDLIALAGVSGRVVNTKVAYFDYAEIGATAGLSSLYRVPFRLLGFDRWQATLAVSRFWRHYGAPDPSINPARTRGEREWRIGVRSEIPVATDWSVFQFAEYRINAANLAVYTRDNVTVAIGVRAGF